MDSCLYVGHVRHRRFAPKPHAFSYRLFMVYLDLAELDRVFAGSRCWSTQQPALAWFRRADYLGDAAVPLDQAVRDWVEARTGTRPSGPIRLLAHLRYFGYCFNPVSFYYCFDAAGEKLETLVAEITNTPWGERFSYVLTSTAPSGSAPVHRYVFAKEFHVSPFFPMDLDYDWRFTEPGKHLSVHMNLTRQEDKVFDATLNLSRVEITPRRLVFTLLTYPFMTLKAIIGIYFEAALLKFKGMPFYDHP
jgi:hypothetical protein